MNITTKSRDAGEGGRGGWREQASLLPVISGSRGSKSALFEMQKNTFQTLIWYNGDTVSYVNKQYMIGREIYLYDCTLIRTSSFSIQSLKATGATQKAYIILYFTKSCIFLLLRL